MKIVPKQFSGFYMFNGEKVELEAIKDALTHVKGLVK